MTTDPIKALVDLGPELQKRYDSRSVMNPTGSILLTYEEAPTILAAIEALTPIASGTSVVVPVEPTEAILEKLRSVLPELFDTNDDTLREIYTDILAAAATPERILELTARIEALEGALKPIAELAKLYNHPSSQPEAPDYDRIIQYSTTKECLTVGDLRRAARAYANKGEQT